MAARAASRQPWSRGARSPEASRGKAPGSRRSSLFTTSTGRRPSAATWRSTASVCARGPSWASTMTRAPSLTRSAAVTSLPNSAWPGQSTRVRRRSRARLRRGSLAAKSRCTVEAEMVMPRSASRPVSSAHALPARSPLSSPAAARRQSESVVLPWSTCATTHTLRTVAQDASSGSAAGAEDAGASAAAPFVPDAAAAAGAASAAPGLEAAGIVKVPSSRTEAGETSTLAAAPCSDGGRGAAAPGRAWPSRNLSASAERTALAARREGGSPAAAAGAATRPPPTASGRLQYTWSPA
mmetsp:Transcript_25132/g.73779  ORF Transcript_25132/g.73779 Transcript_25132/m.73779 type:complete len:296 (-) Transcript_25132:448-1335(-)